MAQSTVEHPAEIVTLDGPVTVASPATLPRLGAVRRADHRRHRRDRRLDHAPGRLRGAAQRYPVLLNVHGGPFTQYGETFFDEAQMQAAAGFVVVMCNPRGAAAGTRRGGRRSTARSTPRCPAPAGARVDVDDVMAVLDARARPLLVLRPRPGRHARRQLRRLHGDDARRPPQRPVPGHLQRAGGQQHDLRGVGQRHRHGVPVDARASLRRGSRRVRRGCRRSATSATSTCRCCSSTPRTTCAARSSRPRSCSSPCACSART